MTVRLAARLIIDYDFFNNVMKTDTMLFWKLMKINTGSKEHKKEHNIISEKIFNRIVEENPTMRPEFIKSSLKRVFEPKEFEDIQDEIARNIKYAIHFSSETPFKVFILTTDNKKPAYEANQHFTGIVDVKILSGETAVRVIDNYCDLCLDTGAY